MGNHLAVCALIATLFCVFIPSNGLRLCNSNFFSISSVSVSLGCYLIWFIWTPTADSFRKCELGDDVCVAQRFTYFIQHSNGKFNSFIDSAIILGIPLVQYPWLISVAVFRISWFGDSTIATIHCTTSVFSSVISAYTNIDFERILVQYKRLWYW